MPSHGTFTFLLKKCCERPLVLENSKNEISQNLHIMVNGLTTKLINSYIYVHVYIIIVDGVLFTWCCSLAVRIGMESTTSEKSSSVSE